MTRSRWCASLFGFVSSLVGLAAGTLCLEGCARTARGELSAGECSNDLDDDNDGKADCIDPDCWVYCPLQQVGQVGDASYSFDASTRPDAQPSPPTQDGGEPIVTPREDAASPTPSEPEDAGTIPTCTCLADEMCVDERCVPRDPSGDYTLKVLSALLPQKNARGRCYDYKLVGCSELIPLCECEKPDPFVRVELNDKAVREAETREIDNTVSPVWQMSPAFKLHLSPADRLTFILIDSDALSNEEIFRCSPDLSALSSGALSCNPEEGMTMAPPRGSSFNITVEATGPE